MKNTPIASSIIIKKLALLCLCLWLTACAKKHAPKSFYSSSANLPGIIASPSAKTVQGQALLSIADLYLQGLRAYHHAQYQQALAKLSAVVKADYTFSPAYWTMGEIYYDLNKLNLAAKNYRQALQYDPQMIDAALQLTRIYIKHQEYHEAKEQLTDVLSLEPQQALALELLEQCKQEAAGYHFKRGQALIKNKKHRSAVAELELAVENNPAFYQAWLELGKLQQNNGQSKRAIESYEKAMRLNPNLPVVWNELGKLYLQSAVYDRARYAFQHSLVLDPGQPGIRAQLKEAQTNFYRLIDLPREYLEISSNQAITRGELAAVLTVNLRSLPHVAQSINGSALIIPDISSHWANQFIIYTVKHNWMQPYPNHNFLPDQRVSRGELAAILDNILNETSLNKTADIPLVFIDISPENQYYKAIMRVGALGLLATYQKGSGVFMSDKAVNGVEALEVVDKLVEALDKK